MTNHRFRLRSLEGGLPRRFLVSRFTWALHALRTSITTGLVIFSVKQDDPEAYCSPQYSSLRLKVTALLDGSMGSFNLVLMERRDVLSGTLKQSHFFLPLLLCPDLVSWICDRDFVPWIENSILARYFVTRRWKWLVILTSRSVHPSAHTPTF